VQLYFALLKGMYFYRYNIFINLIQLFVVIVNPTVMLYKKNYIKTCSCCVVDLLFAVLVQEGN
jgi:hypothetical protein